jgi:HEAT repeat protein
MRHALIVGMLLTGPAGARAADLPTLPETITALVQKLGDPEPAVRLKAIRDLGRLGKAARPAVPALAQAVRDRTAGIGPRAAQALAQIGAMKELIQGAQDKDVRPGRPGRPWAGRIHGDWQLCADSRRHW